MAALGDVLALSGATILEVTPVSEVKSIHVRLPATVDSSDTFTLDLNKYGCNLISGIIGWRHSTTGQVVVTDAPTTAVAAGVLTVTLDASAANQVRTYLIFAY